MDILLMLHLFRRSHWLAAALIGTLAMGMAAPARADLEILLSPNGSTWTKAAHEPSGTGATYSNSNYNHFGISMLSDDSNSPGDTGGAYLEGADLHIVNNNSTICTLYIKLSDTGFTSPITSVDNISLDSEIGGSVTKGGKDNTLTFQSYVDPNNGEASLLGFTTGVQTPTITGNPSSYNNDTSIIITKGLTGTYSITEVFKITLDPGSQIGFSSSTTLAYAPEPSSLALAVLGATGLIGHYMHRRRAIRA